MLFNFKLQPLNGFVKKSWFVPSFQINNLTYVDETFRPSRYEGSLYKLQYPYNLNIGKYIFIPDHAQNKFVTLP